MMMTNAAMAALSIVINSSVLLAGAADLDSASSKAPETSRFAYVSLLCNPLETEEAEQVRMMMVLKESIRQFDQDNDIVTMLHGNMNEEQWQILDHEGIRIVNVEDVGRLVSDPEPLRVPDDVSECYRSKLNVLKLKEYEKVIFIDTDSMVKEDLRFMFEDDDFIAYEGYQSPLNGALFAVKPSDEALKDIEDIFASDNFHPTSGWMDFGTFPHWRLDGHHSDWSFWGAHADQGILYYYYDKVSQTASIRPMSEGARFVTHFSSWNKPIVHNSGDLVDVRFRESHAEWYNLWDRVQERTNHNEMIAAMKTTGLKSKSKSAATKAQVKRALQSDPYCEAPAFMWLVQASTGADLGPIVAGTIIDLSTLPCGDLTILAGPTCKESMKFTMRTDPEGVKVAATKENNLPFSLGTDIDATGELQPEPALDVADEYTMVLNPKPGSKVTIPFTITGSC